MLNVGLDKPCNKVSLYISFQKFHPKVLFKSFQKRKLNHSAGRPHEKKKKEEEGKPTGASEEEGKPTGASEEDRGAQKLHLFCL